LFDRAPILYGLEERSAARTRRIDGIDRVVTMSAEFQPTSPTPVVTAVVPLFNEQENVEELHRSLDLVLQGLNLLYEILLVDDGSKDSTPQLIDALVRRRRHVPETLAAAFAGKDLELKLVFWWGCWPVPVLKHQRSRRRSRTGENSARVYRHYLKLPPWPIPWAARLAFFIERRLALRNMFKTGTSLFAVARRAVPVG
jgi:cellulose synthase/poly-beta-1,6-N-acetylglucosamine synthase-like glycosyltransferase